MANHMWICPTKRQDEFYDIDKLISILKDKLPEFNYFNCGIGRYSDSQLPVGFITINVSKNKVDLFQMYCYTESPLDATDSDNKNMTIEDLDKMGYEDLADKLIGFLENDGANPSKCIEIRHTPYSKEIIKLCKFMRRYFQAIIFDEGIHPEYLLPLPENEKDVEKKSFIKKFIDWTNK